MDFPVVRQLDHPIEKRLEAVAKRVGVLAAAQDALDHAVRLARQEGASWADVGMAAGMSKQAAHQRWGG